MKTDSFKELKDFEGEVYLWVEQESSIMLKAVSNAGDPVELTSNDARNLAKFLNDAAEKLEQELIK